MDAAVFIDRDGVIIKNRPNYVRSWQQVAVYPQAVKALARLSSSPYKVIIVTNQAGVGRGFFPLSLVEEINARLVQIIETAGGRVDGVFVCPHSPQEGCECRKPKPGLLLQAASCLHLALHRSFMIGDALSDILAGRLAGVRDALMVRTGRGRQQLKEWAPARLAPFPVYRNLSEAVQAVLVSDAVGSPDPLISTEDPAAGW